MALALRLADPDAVLTEDERWRNHRLRLRTAFVVNAVVVVFVYASALAEHFLGFYRRDFTPGHCLVAGMLLVVALLAAANEWHARARRFSPAAHLYGIGTALYLLNLVATAVMVHLTGGAESVYPLLWVLLAGIGSFIVPARVVASLAAVGVALHGALLWAEARGIVSPEPPGFFRLPGGFPRAAASAVVWTAYAAMTAAALFFGRRLHALYESQRAQIADHRANLERLVATRTAELSRAVADLRSTTATLDAEKRRQEAFFAHVTHQFRTPIHAIASFVDNFQGGVYGPVAARQAETLQLVRMSAGNLLSLINNLLDTAAIRSGAKAVRAEPTNVTDLIDRTLRAMQPIADARGVTLVRETDGPPRDIVTDRAKVEAILGNVVHNAVKFSKNAPVVLRATAADGGNALSVAVADAGPGIAPEDRERAFEAFERLASPEGFRGSGLGLHIARTYARLLGGDLTVAETPGGGATFTLRLPVAPRGAEDR